ncbi:MAG: DUF6290 family protein [Defluviitaleaceae bacterium]|nr:DUF6290 family protein [Defluviitaleaceae bacterium]
MTKNTTLNVRISEDEYTLFKAFADFHGETMTSMVLNTIRTMMEDWEDIRDAEEVLSRNEPTYSLAEVKRELGV